MGVLEQIMQMKGQGLSDGDVIRTLQEQGIPPLQINNALSQAQIKNAIGNNSDDKMQPSIMQQGEENMKENTEDTYTPQAPQNQSYSNPQSQGQAQQDYSQYYPQQEQYYSEQGYGDNYGVSSQGYTQGYAGNYGSDTNSIIELSNQVFLEKSKEMKKDIGNIKEFKAIFETKVNNIDERLKKIEKIIDNLQIKILQEVGSYGKNLDSIKKEMSMMQDSFSKIVDPVVEHKKKKK